MKREFLKDLGLADEAIDKIMAENGRDVEAQKTLTTAETTKLATANQTIKDLQDTVKKFDGVDVKALNDKIAELQTKYDADTAALRLGNAIDAALRDGKARNPKLVKAALDMEKIKLDGDKLLGMDDQLTALKKSDAYLFNEETSPAKSGVQVDSGKPHEKAPGSDGRTLADEIKASLYGTPKT